MLNMTNILANWKGVLTALVSVLIIIPSVLNSIGDVWVAWQNLPVGRKEKINNKLFKVHFKENPVHTKQLIIESPKGKLPVTLDVYKNGDILVNYSLSLQWFPMDSNIVAASKVQYVRDAQAGFFFNESKDKKQVTEVVGSETKKVYNVKKSNNEIERIRVLSDGSTEKLVIDINSGEVKSQIREPSRGSVVKTHESSEGISGVEVIRTSK